MSRTVTVPDDLVVPEIVSSTSVSDAPVVVAGTAGSTGRIDRGNAGVEYSGGSSHAGPMTGGHAAWSAARTEPGR